MVPNFNSQLSLSNRSLAEAGGTGERKNPRAFIPLYSYTKSLLARRIHGIWLDTLNG